MSKMIGLVVALAVFVQIPERKDSYLDVNNEKSLEMIGSALQVHFFPLSY